MRGRTAGPSGAGGSGSRLLVSTVTEAALVGVYGHWRVRITYGDCAVRREGSVDPGVTRGTIASVAVGAGALLLEGVAVEIDGSKFSPLLLGGPSSFVLVVTEDEGDCPSLLSRIVVGLINWVPESVVSVVDPLLMSSIILVSSVLLLLGNGNCVTSSLASLYRIRKEDISVGRGAVKSSAGVVARRLIMASSAL